MIIHVLNVKAGTTKQTVDNEIKNKMHVDLYLNCKKKN